MPQSKAVQNSEIVEAINKERCLIFFYKDLLRIVEPYCYGVSKNGRYLLRGFQIGGKSSSGRLPGWRLFHVGEMENIKLTDLKFLEERPDFNENDPAMQKILCRINKVNK